MSEPDLSSIARECHAYESILEAQGYGISLANSAAAEPVCDQCVNWQEGYCVIYRHCLPAYQVPSGSTDWRQL